MARLEEEARERLAAHEEWLTSLQVEADRTANKLDTGRLNLKNQLDGMGKILTGMSAQQRRMLPIEELDPEDLNPQNVEGAFLNPYIPIAYKLRKSFDREELALLAHEVGVDIEDLGGSGLLDICRRLVDYAARRKGERLLELLMKKAGEHRPPAEQWSELL